MSLATRCTACGTIFRVVQDQLRVSEGWVRCGRCAEVFDAREQLFDIDREAPPPWPEQEVDLEPQAGPAVISLGPEPEPEPEPSHDDDQWQAVEPAQIPGEEPEPAAPVEAQAFDARPEPQWFDEARSDAPPRPIEPPSERMEPPAIAAELGPDVVLAPRLAEMKPMPELGSASGPDAAIGSTPMPDFMRPARKRAGPVERIALGLLSLLLLLLLGGQIALHFHDALAALYPPARPALQAVCKLAGCELRPWRRIEALSVENSALNQAGAGNQFQLTVSLRNKSAVEVALPWVELNLTDAAGAVVLRRMLAPSDFANSAGSISLAGGAERSLQLLLSSGNQRVSGYSVEIFHP
ncbi:zinc-ribbon and DUF3426 domain-containing protein [Roseateles violae]|uniref:Zinc-ribbon and DUF3426 domain-containing protein n=1 Tax=Roseateles violae TaxID=3058042 RepID=A0ABT8DSJ6_9BURK|nr:zinc-ribbon and DUF3426 domain-containing protein [Pelomonas sp. PFR6]MDN3921053.1 zinc-ribbon and DUF3426 domain-containing protein [Pelomonas sp. PFR6]